jgi:hypothetical protein
MMNTANISSDLVFETRRFLVSKNCPCGKNNRDGKFVPFKGYTDKGYCHSCGQTFLPELQQKEERFLFPNTKGQETWKPVDYLPFDLMDKSVTEHKRCDLYPFLEMKFRETVASELCYNYFIGTNKNANTTFWQVDINANVRQGKVMKYDSNTGKRDRNSITTFIGKKVLGNEANLQQCFFGEFLLSFPENMNKPVAIVESEKTCVIASIYFPEFIWLATGGKHGVKMTEKSVCKILAGKSVVLFPDLGAYGTWKEKGTLMSKVAGCKVAVSDLLEKHATEEEKSAGLDIADFLLKEQDSSQLALTDFGYPIIIDIKSSAA